MNILIFGKDGQLGKAFQSIFATHKLGKLHRIYFAGRTQCDFSNAHVIANLLQQFKPQLIINAAAYTAVDQAEQEIDLAYAVNAHAPAIMAQYAAKEGATLVHYSTDYVFDGTKTTPYLETDVRNPLGIYGKSKAAGEVAIEDAFRSHPHSQAQFTILRTSWVYGDGGNFIRTILRLAKERESLNVIADEFGVPTSAHWLASISLALVLDENHQLRSFSSGIYHVVPQGEITRYALATYALEAAINAGTLLRLDPARIVPIPTANYAMDAPRPKNSRLDTKKLQQVFIDRGDQSSLDLCKQIWNLEVNSYLYACVKQMRSRDSTIYE